MLIVHEEVGLVAAVVDVRNFQRAADICAEAIIVVADFRRFDSGNRVWPGIERGIFVAIVESEANPIHLLAKKTAATSAAELASASRATSCPAPSSTTAATKDRSATSAGAASAAKPLSTTTRAAWTTLSARAAGAFGTSSHSGLRAQRAH